MRNVTQLALAMIVATTWFLAPTAQAQTGTPHVLPFTLYTYQDNEGSGALSIVTDPNAQGNVRPIGVTLTQGNNTLAGSGTQQVITATRSEYQFTLRKMVGNTPVGPSYLFTGTVFSDPTGTVGGGTYTIAGLPGFSGVWFIH
jgi:hypothetical protein